MLIQRLLEHSRQIGLNPLMHRPELARYVLDLSPDGRVQGIEDLAVPDDPARRLGLRLALPYVRRSSNVQPFPFADNAAYTFGIAREDDRADRVEAYHEAYRLAVAACAEATGDLAAQAVRAWLDQPGFLPALPSDFDPKAKIILRVDGEVVSERPAIQAWWVRSQMPDEGDQMQCLGCGQVGPVMRRLRGAIRGIPEGQATGTALVSANSPAYESYGLAEGYLAPLCADCGDRAVQTLNHLLADRRSRVIVGGVVIVFWSSSHTETLDVATLLDPADEEALGLALAALYRGRYDPAWRQARGYAVALSAHGARIMVRTAIDETLDELAARIACWFEWQQLVWRNGEPGHPLGVRALAAAVARPDQEPPPTIVRDLVEAALGGKPVPWAYLLQALRRARAGQGPSYEQAALIKLVLLSHGYEGVKMAGLDEDNREPGYLAGRLLAILERLQYAALGRVNASVSDRYFGRMMSSPASIVPFLMQNAQAHLRKLRRYRRGATAVALERQIHAILEHVDPAIGWPRAFSPPQQGLFALGYHHQRAADFAAARVAGAGKDDPQEQDTLPGANFYETL
jgi:CRISPR-associated protein Csd1